MRALKPNHVLVLTKWFRVHRIEIVAWGKDNEITWRIGPTKLRALPPGDHRSTRIIAFPYVDDATAFTMRWLT